MAINQIISDLPPAPQRNDAPADFVTKADAHVASLPVLVSQLNTFGDEVNSTQTEVNLKAAQVSDNATAAAGSAAEASASALTAAANANFKGEWSNLSGALAVPASVRHQNRYWQLLSDVADVTTVEPSEASAFWSLIDAVNMENVRLAALQNPFAQLFAQGRFVKNLKGAVSVTRASAATYTNRHGGVSTADIDEPRESREGWLFERAATNLMLHSESFDNAAWVKYDGVVVTANAETAPDGTLTADSLDLSATAGARIEQAVTVAGGTAQSFSLYVKAPAGSTFAATLVSAGGTPTSETGTLVTTGFWQRLEITLTLNADNTGVFVLIGGAAAQQTTFSVWGAQLETNACATSYIPTTSATATRTADAVTSPALGNLPDTTRPFSVFWRVGAMGVPNGATKIGFIAPVAGGFFYLTGSPTVQVIEARFDRDVVGEINTRALPYPLGEEFCVALVFDGSTLSLYVNSVKATSAFLGQPPQVNTEAAVTFADAGGASSSPTKDLRFYDFALNEDEVRALI